MQPVPAEFEEVSVGIIDEFITEKGFVNGTVADRPVDRPDNAMPC